MVSFFTEVCASLSLKGRERRRAGPCAQEQVRSSQRRLTLLLACVAVVLCPQPGGPSWGGKSCRFPSSPRLRTCHSQTMLPQAMFTPFSNRWAAPPCLGRVRKGNEKQGFSLCFLSILRKTSSQEMERGPPLPFCEPKAQDVLPIIPVPAHPRSLGCPLPWGRWAEGLGSQYEIDWQLPSPTFALTLIFIQGLWLWSCFSRQESGCSWQETLFCENGETEACRGRVMWQQSPDKGQHWPGSQKMRHVLPSCLGLNFPHLCNGDGCL